LQYLDFIAQDAQQNFPIVREYDMEIRRSTDGFRIIDDKEVYETTSAPWDFIYTLMGRIHSRAFDDLPRYVRMHAGCAEYQGKRGLVAGDKGAGKTTLMTYLLLAGFRVDGDELVLFDENKSVPFPRRFHIKAPSLDLVPQIRPVLNNRLYLESDVGVKIYSFAPSDAGFDWLIEKKEVRLLFYLQPDHNGKTRIEKYPKYLMAQKLMPLTFFSEKDDHQKIKKLCDIVDNSLCFQLKIGNLDHAVTVIRETVSMA